MTSTEDNMEDDQLDLNESKIVPTTENEPLLLSTVSLSVITSQDRYCYQLAVTGSEATLNSYLNAEGRNHIWKMWNSKTPFILKRRMFPEFAGLLRLSRRHLKIICEEDNIQKKFWVVDLSANGTLLNGKKMEKEAQEELKHGDQLGLLWRKNATLNTLEVLFGVQFTVFDERTAPPVASELFKSKNSKTSLSKNKNKRKELSGSPRKKEDKENDVDDQDLREKKRKQRRMNESGDLDVRKSSRSEKEKAKQEEETEEYPVSTSLEKLDLSLKKSDRVLKWTQEEEEKLMEVMQTNEGQSWKDVSFHFPLRSPDAVRNKYKKMTESSSKSKSKYKQKESKHSDASSPPNEEAAAEEPEPEQEEEEEEQEEEEEEEQQEEDEEQEQEQEQEQEVEIPLTADEDRSRKLWTPEDDELLRELVIQYRPTTQEDWEKIALKLGRTVKSVKHKYNDKRMYELLN